VPIYGGERKDGGIPDEKNSIIISINYGRKGEGPTTSGDPGPLTVGPEGKRIIEALIDNAEKRFYPYFGEKNAGMLYTL